MMKIAAFCLIALLPTLVNAQWDDREKLDPLVTEVWKEVPKVTPAEELGQAPSDAIVLFDGDDLDSWTQLDGSAAQWDVKDGAFTVKRGAGNIKTKQTFGDVQLHLEWRAPTEVEGPGQDQGNSGVFFQEMYEIQVLDTYTTSTYANGQAGAIYKQHPPLVNANKPPMTWQTYDIIFRAPVFDDNGNLKVPARLTAFLNGILIQDNVTLWGPTEYRGLPVYKAHGEGSLMLQDHGNPVGYRNIWVREL